MQYGFNGDLFRLFGGGIMNLAKQIIRASQTGETVHGRNTYGCDLQFKVENDECCCYAYKDGRFYRQTYSHRDPDMRELCHFVNNCLGIK